MLAAAAQVAEPPRVVSPSRWAELYRRIKPGTSEKDGRWDPDYFPHLGPVMDAVQEALEAGYDGLVLMKSAQGGGSEGMLNALGWCRTYLRGPMAYLISKEELARDFARERLDWMNKTAEPLQAIWLKGERGTGETVQTKRYTTGRIAIMGGRATTNLESQPYVVVFVDEIDSLQDNLPGKGDLIKTIRARTKAFRGRVLIVAFAHPTDRSKGAGKLYYGSSDQRRGFIDCPHCAEPFWLNWDRDVKVFPEGDETQQQAERNPKRYLYVTPCCGAIMTDAERWRAIRTVRQESTLPPEEAASKRWMGVHFSELYYPHATLEALAADWIDGIDNEPVRRVTVNKSHGDVFEPKVRETKPEDWRALIRIPRRAGDPEAYVLGEVPPGVRFLTAGQDSRTTELHYTVWGWGLLRSAEGTPERVAWLVDCGIVKRAYTETIEASDLAVFDQLLLRRAWPRTDGSGHLYLERAYFDSGWCPLAVAEYVRDRERAYAVRGDNVDSNSTAPIHRWGSAMRYLNPEGEEYVDEANKPAIVNTYKLKSQWFGLVGKRFQRADELDAHTRIVLPQDAPEDFILQSSSEFLRRDERGRLFWSHRGPNHYSDCNIYALGAALQLDPWQRGKTRDEAIQEAREREERRARKRTRGGGRRRSGRDRVRRSY